MAQKPRAIRMEQRGGLAAMSQLESRSDEELESETKHRAAAQAILGARAADRYDAERARGHFKRAIAAARPQERMQLRRMADASLALAERRAGDLKSSLEKLGQAPPSDRQLLMLRFMGLIAPPPGASGIMKLRGFALLFLLVATLIAIGFGIVELVSIPFGGVGVAGGILLGMLVVVAVLGALAVLGKRRQRKARTAAAGG